MPSWARPGTLQTLNAQVVACNLCPRLRTHCTEVARTRRRAYTDWEYWGRPVPSFGDPKARVLALGLAPGAHGSNRTGRPFTGDGSGDFLFPVLHEAGFASQPTATSRDDGMKLNGLWITAVARCAPPGNKPTPEELRNCAPWLDLEMRLLTNCAWWYVWAASRSMACWRTSCAWALAKTRRLRFRARSRIRVAKRTHRDCELSSVAAKYQHRQAHAAHAAKRLQASAQAGRALMNEQEQGRTQRKERTMEQIEKAILKDVLLDEVRPSRESRSTRLTTGRSPSCSSGPRICANWRSTATAPPRRRSRTIPSTSPCSPSAAVAARLRSTNALQICSWCSQGLPRWSLAARSPARASPPPEKRAATPSQAARPKICGRATSRIYPRARRIRCCSRAMKPSPAS